MPELYEIDVINRERQKLLKFFGPEVFNSEIREIPSLPAGITPERLLKWRKLGFEPRYLPRISMNEGRSFPGWRHKPGKRYTPEQRHGIEFFDEGEKIKNQPDNRTNVNLSGLSPVELPGAWALIDTRKKPNYKKGAQVYHDDGLMQGIIQNLAERGIVNKEASHGRRSYIHPTVFKQAEFWLAIRDVLGLDGITGAVVRLPRVIEANFLGQGPGFNDTDTWEWCEEYYESGRCFISGGAKYGGASGLVWGSDWVGIAGFRPQVIFPRA